MKKVIVVIVVFCVLLGIHLKNNNSPAQSQPSTGLTAPGIVEKKSTSVSKDSGGEKLVGTVKVGEVSENIWIAARRFYVFPNGDGVVYILTDIYGKVSETTEAGDWTSQKILYVRFKPTKNDISYIVKDWE